MDDLNANYNTPDLEYVLTADDILPPNSTVEEVSNKLRNVLREEPIDFIEKFADANRDLIQNILCIKAVEHDRLDVLTYAHENGYNWDASTCSTASKFGNLECLEYLYENRCPWDEETCIQAATNGMSDCLKYAHTRGCPWNDLIIQVAIVINRLDIIIYYREEEPTHVWNKTELISALSMDRLNIIKYIKNSGYPINSMCNTLETYKTLLTDEQITHNQSVLYLQSLCTSNQQGGSTNISSKKLLVEAIILVIIIILASVFHL